MKIVIRDAILALLISLLAASVVNAVRPDGLDWIARQDYQILVPCPEPIGEAIPLSAEKAWPRGNGDLLIDSRKAETFQNDRLPDAIHIPFDYLSPVPTKEIQRIVESKAKRIIVVGDGQTPDTGEELAKELSGRGIKNVYFVQGGMDELKKFINGR